MCFVLCVYVCVACGSCCLCAVWCLFFCAFVRRCACSNKTNTNKQNKQHTIKCVSSYQAQTIKCVGVWAGKMRPNIKQKTEQGYSGLVNLGNTCYQNSFLQRFLFIFFFNFCIFFLFCICCLCVLFCFVSIVCPSALCLGRYSCAGFV